MRRWHALCALCVLVLCVPGLRALAGEEPDVWERLERRIGEVWRSSSYGLYVPVYTWHNRLFYDQNKVGRYNEYPWGLGVGKSLFDEDGDWHTLYVMGFMDSNDHFQPIGGYGFLKYWYPGDRDGFRYGVGYTLSVTARHEYNYIPIPLPLPVVGMGYDRFSIQAAYVPGTYNNGNVLFTWMHWQFDE